MKYLITGSKGQLAREFIRTFEGRSADYSAPDETLCDITDQRSVKRAVAEYRPDVIVNCAAYNLVDRAESDPETAMQVNALGPRHLAEAAERHGAQLVHFGSDYVFDGEKSSGLYTEEDESRPVNEYGRSKRAGEIAVAEVLGGRALVLRLSWVYGGGTQNFIHKFRERVTRRDPLAATCDEFSVPTWTGTVVTATLRALDRGLTGLLHLTGSGYCSRFEWARAVLKALGEERFVLPVSMASFGLPAKRPRFSAMSNLRISNALGITIPPWEETVSEFVKKGAGT